MTARIEDYALLGDGETAALVDRRASIDWLCWPRFDSDACFASLLGNAEHGRWQIAPRDDAAAAARRYQPDTLVLETDFTTDTGGVRVTDFMPMRSAAPTLVRIVTGLRGEVAMRMDLCLRFDYGLMPPWTEPVEGGFTAKVGPDLVVLRAAVPVEVERHSAHAAFSVAAGQRLAFVLSYGASTDEPPGQVDAERALAETQAFWRTWIGKFDKPTDWPDAVRRSLITLKALVHRPSGGLIAAPTTSLPEQPGGSSNWDYRYCWLRDATFTLSALLNAGYEEEARGWQAWILRAIAGSPDRLRIMYRVDGARRLDERTIDWLPGFRSASPVREGNLAAGQHQVDVYGELLDALDLAARAGIESGEQCAHVQQAVMAELERVWDSAGQGLWESRGQPRHYTYSRAMAWVGVDRFLRSAAAGRGVEAATLQRFARLRDQIHQDVCRNGFDDGLGHFVQHYGGQELDASLLLLPIVGFLPADDPRIAATVAAIERDLMQDGLVRRTRAEGPNPEGAFLACSFWLADCQSMQGRAADARRTFERVLAVRNDLGLLSEEYNVPGRHLAGNFPQALSHLGLVTTGLSLSGPVLTRGGG